MTSIVVISKPLLPSGLPAQRFVLELARMWPTLISWRIARDIQTSVMEQSTQLGYRIEASLGDP